MLQKKASPDLAETDLRRLESLYAHRRALDALIESLERYDKLRANMGDLRKLREIPYRNTA